MKVVYFFVAVMIWMIALHFFGKGMDAVFDKWLKSRGKIRPDIREAYIDGYKGGLKKGIDMSHTTFATAVKRTNELVAFQLADGGTLMSASDYSLFLKEHLTVMYEDILKNADVPAEESEVL